MYNSQYYTCEQIDERLLQGYLDDYNTQTGQSLTKAQFLTKLGSIFSKEGVIDNTTTQIGYYECDTAAGTAAKAITVANYALFAGGSMKVKFANKNTANNATLNINSQGAKALYYQGERASATNSWDANEVVEIYYDGTSYYANNVKGGSGSGVYDVSKEHPTSGPNSDGKFTLEYILNPSNVNELIPVNKRYPGMSIQFVSTSDNNYIQARCMAQDFTTDITQWEVATDEPIDNSKDLLTSGGAAEYYGKYVKNPKFIDIKLDANKRILWAIKADGTIYYGAGVPPQVVDYINGKITELGLGSVNDIIAFLDGLDEGENTLQQLLNLKVDKVAGKGLSTNDFTNDEKEVVDCNYLTDNPYYMCVELDSERRLLGGRKINGTKFENLPIENPSSTSESITHPKWIDVKKDCNNKLLEALDADGNKVIGGNLEVKGKINGYDIQEEIVALNERIEEIEVNPHNKEKTYFNSIKVSNITTKPFGSLLYNGDDKVQTNHIVNAVSYPNGIIIAARVGSIVKIDLDGTETTLLTIAGASDWRGLFMDKDLNVYASPHASIGSPGGFQMANRGLYKLPYGGNSFTKVISLYDTTSSDTYETQSNNDTIWTMCQDHKWYLYAGVYCHTVRWAPRIYRSTDGGDTWVDYYDFLPLLPNGHHVHTIIYNEYNNALYCIIGEINTVLKSVDNGTTWTNLNAACEYEKGSSMIAVKDGVIIGSDGGFQLSISKLYADDKTVKTVARAWANTIFAIRKSDVTGWLYAFTKIDSSVNVLDYMPPMEAINDASVLAAWKAGTYGTMSAPPSKLSLWENYNNLVKNYWPDDAIRPQHIGILVSKDNGETWEVILYKQVESSGQSGFVTTGYFRNGECLTGFFEGTAQNPIIIREERLKYTANGVDLSGDIYIKTNNNNIINI